MYICIYIFLNLYIYIYTPFVYVYTTWRPEIHVHFKEVDRKTTSKIPKGRYCDLASATEPVPEGRHLGWMIRFWVVWGWHFWKTLKVNDQRSDTPYANYLIQRMIRYFLECQAVKLETISNLMQFGAGYGGAADVWPVWLLMLTDVSWISQISTIKNFAPVSRSVLYGKINICMSYTYI